MRRPGPESSPLEREPNEFRLRFGMVSERSLARERANEPNEDQAFCTEQGEVGVFDGMGGHDAGEVASSIAVDAVRDYFAAMREEIKDAEDARVVIQEALYLAHMFIADENSSRRNYRDMGTTAVVGLIVRPPDAAPVLVLGWVGDSRALLEREGHLEILTVDDSPWLQDLPDDERGRQQRLQAMAETDEDLKIAVARPKKLVLDPSITQALGLRASSTLRERAIDIHIAEQPLKPGDRLIFDTDGINDPVTLPRISRAIRGKKPAAAARALITESRRTLTTGSPRRKDDDATAVVIDVEGA